MTKNFKFPRLKKHTYTKPTYRWSGHINWAKHPNIQNMTDLFRWFSWASQSLHRDVFGFWWDPCSGSAVPSVSHTHLCRTLRHPPRQRQASSVPIWRHTLTILRSTCGLFNVTRKCSVNVNSSQSFHFHLNLF